MSGPDEQAEAAVDPATREFTAQISPVLNSVRANWVAIWLAAEVPALEPVRCWACCLTAPPDQAVRYFTPPPEAAEAFARLHAASREQPRHRWSAATLTVRRDATEGPVTFRLDYSYRAVPAARQARRARRWEAAFLPAGIPVVRDADADGPAAPAAR